MTGVVQYRVSLEAQGTYGTDTAVNTGSTATTRVMTGVAAGVYYVRVESVDSGPAWHTATGDVTNWFPGTINVGRRWQDQWNVKVYAFGLQPLTKPTATSLVVGHATRGQISGSNVLADLSDPWTQATDLSCYVTRIRIDQGKTQALESFGPSRCTVELEATDDRFDPRSTTGAYCVSSRQLFRRGVPIVVCVEGAGDAVATSTRRYLWCGWLARTSMEQAPYGDLRTHTAEMFDPFDRLGAYDQNAFESVVGSGDTLLARVERWLKLANVVANDAVATTTAFQLSNDQYGFDGAYINTTLQSTDMSANALSAVKAAAASCSDVSGNRGVVYVAPNGQVRVAFFGLVAVSSGGLHFSDDPLSVILNGGGTAVNIAKRSVQQIDESAFRNVARFARRGSTTMTAIGAAVDVNWSVEQRTDLESVDDANVQLMANRFVAIYGGDFAAGGPTTWTHTINPILESTAFDYATQATVMAQADDSWVLGWSHDIGPNQEWMTTVTTSEVP